MCQKKESESSCRTVIYTLMLYQQHLYIYLLRLRLLFCLLKNLVKTLVNKFLMVSKSALKL